MPSSDPLLGQSDTGTKVVSITTKPIDTCPSCGKATRSFQWDVCPRCYAAKRECCVPEGDTNG